MYQEKDFVSALKVAIDNKYFSKNYSILFSPQDKDCPPSERLAMQLPNTGNRSPNSYNVSDISVPRAPMR